MSPVTKIFNVEMARIFVIVGLLIAGLLFSALAVWLALSGFDVVFIYDRFYTQPALQHVTKIEVFNGRAGLSYDKTLDITDQTKISRITTIVNRYRTDWFDASRYPNFSSDIQLTFVMGNNMEPVTISVGAGGWEMMMRQKGGKYLELYNQMGVSKFSNPAARQTFYAICKAVGERFFETACYSRSFTL